MQSTTSTSLKKGDLISICGIVGKIKDGGYNESAYYLDFANMLEKTEIMIFTTELPSRYYGQLNKLNRKVKIFIPKKLAKTISILEEKHYGDNMVLL